MGIPYLIISITMLFMMIFTMSSTVLGSVRPILSVAFFGLFLYCIVQFVIETRRSIVRPTDQENQDKYRDTLEEIMGKKVKRRKFDDGF